MKARTVYPVDGRYLTGIPHVVHICDDPMCVESGAFTEDPPPKAAQPKSQGPADAGPLDSKE